MTKSQQAFKLVAAIVVSELAGFVGALFTAPAIDTWYATLEKSPLTPPGWVFGPVWTTLYALMGIAAFLIWKRGLGKRAVRIALGVFLFQLALNALWSIIFFGFHAPALALVELIALWVAIVGTIVAFQKVSVAAAWLLAPYLAWVTFAGYLNYSIWILN